jgi:hypothetical protein
MKESWWRKRDNHVARPKIRFAGPFDLKCRIVRGELDSTRHSQRHQNVRRSILEQICTRAIHRLSRALQQGTSRTHSFVGIPNFSRFVYPNASKLLAITIPRDMRYCLRSRVTVVLGLECWEIWGLPGGEHERYMSLMVEWEWPKVLIVHGFRGQQMLYVVGVTEAFGEVWSPRLQALKSWSTASADKYHLVDGAWWRCKQTSDTS